MDDLMHGLLIAIILPFPWYKLQSIERRFFHPVLVSSSSA
jgi:hypothetical protein